jgi:hypothetical protein
MSTIRIFSDDEVSAFIRGYIGCALWSSTDQSREDGGDPLDRNYSSDDIATDARYKIETECRQFLSANADAIDDYGATDEIQAIAESDGSEVMDCAGHDLWLTRNGHGTGFWDRGVGDVGDKLADAARSLGESTMYVGDDGKLYV